MCNKLVAVVAIYCAIFGWSGSMIQAEFQAFSDNDVKLPTDRLSEYVRPTKYDINMDFRGVHDRPIEPYRNSGSTPSAGAAPASGYMQTASSVAPTKMHYIGSVVIDVEFHGPAQVTPKRRSPLKKFVDHFKVCAGKFPAPNEDEECVLFAPDTIVMHADKDVEIAQVEVLVADKKNSNKMAPLKVTKTARDTAKQLISLELADNLPTGGRVGQIRFKFSAPVRSDLHGVYLGASKSNGHVYEYVVAKFQPTFARLALPCFDEPSFKAEFVMSFKYDVSKPDRPMDAYATMDGTKTTYDTYHETRFEPTPRMSIHMVAFIVGSFDPQPLTKQIRPDLRLRFLTTPGQSTSGEFALEVAHKTIDLFEKYIDYKFPLKKLDVVSIGDTDQENTETWGLVFVRETKVAVDDETQLNSRVGTAINVAHVCVHQWFANLVTANWWDNLWITENVAAEMSFEITDKLFPDYQSDYFARISTLSSILSQDVTGLVHTVSPPEDKLTTSAQIYEIFDVLSFMKSGAMGRMIQHTVGFDHFQAALQQVVKRFAYKNFDSNDFLACLSDTAKPGQDMEAVKLTMESFMKLSSFPLINIDLGNDPQGKQSVVAYLEPFYKAGKQVDVSKPQESTLAWRTPLNVLVSDATGLKRTTVDFVWDSGLKATATLPDWFNHDEHFLKVQHDPDFSTYYRVRYSNGLLVKLQTPIEEKKLSPMDRLHILNDADALVKAQLIANDQYRQLFDWHKNEDNPAVTLQMLVAAQTLAKLELSTKDPSPSNAVFLEVYKKHGFRVEGGETALEERARSATLKVLVGKSPVDGPVVVDALATFDKGDVALFLREPVYAAVVKAGTQQQVNQLLDHLAKTSSFEERARLASALALSENDDVLRRLADSLNEPFSFRQTAVAQIVQSSSKLAFDSKGFVVVK